MATRIKSPRKRSKRRIKNRKKTKRISIRKIDISLQSQKKFFQMMRDPSIYSIFRNKTITMIAF